MERVAANTDLWSSPGQYMERSTLTGMFKVVSGSELPPALYRNTTFEEDGTSPFETDNASMNVAASVSEHLVAMKLIGKRDEEDSDDSDDSDSDG